MPSHLLSNSLKTWSLPKLNFTTFASKINLFTNGERHCGKTWIFPNYPSPPWSGFEPRQTIQSNYHLPLTPSPISTSHSCSWIMISVARKFSFLNILNKSYYNNLFAYLLHQPEIASHIVSLCTCNDLHPCVYNLSIQW